MAINENITHTISAEWVIKGSAPTVKEILEMAGDLERSDIPKNTVVHFEPPYSDTQTYAARFFIKPFEFQNKPVAKRAQ